jgi:DNA-binding transcriptional MerR regulator
MAFTVKRVAEMAGISVRTLHHYDEIGLLRPTTVSAAGYRLYEAPDLQRLQQILLFKEMGLALEEIRAILDQPGYDLGEALLQHRTALLERRQRLDRLIASIDKQLADMERGRTMAEMSDKELQELFDGFDHKQYEAEAEQRWGHTEAYKESARRTAKYTKADWVAIKAEMESIGSDLAALVGQDPADPAVQAVIERHFRHINDRFYTCTPEIYRGLGELYVTDPRFTANIDKVKPGLAAFWREAINRYCDRLEGKA